MAKKQTQNQRKPMDMAALDELLSLRSETMKKLAGKLLKPELLIKLYTLAASRNRDLLLCTPTSLIASALYCAEVKLKPSAGHVHLIPLKNRQVQGEPMEVNVWTGYLGYKILMLRHPDVRMVEARLYHEEDEFDLQYGSDPRIIHRPALGDRGAVLGAYFVGTLATGEKILDDLDLAGLEKRRKVSKKKNSGPWDEWTHEMYRKTMIIAGRKQMPESDDISIAIARDPLFDDDNQLTAGDQATADLLPAPERSATDTALEAVGAAKGD